MSSGRMSRETPPPAASVLTATIASGATVSSAIDTYDKVLLGVIWPADMDGTAVSVPVCDTVDGTYKALVDSTGAAAATYTVSGVKGKAMALVAAQRDLIAPFRFLKFTSNAAGPNYETADRTFTIVTKGGR